MEDFLTGHPGNEEALRRHLRGAMGTDAYEAFYETFFAEDDAVFLTDMGLNAARISVNGRYFERDSSVA